MGQMEKVAEVLGKHYVPVFIKECAARGITFDTEKELESAIENASMLKQAEARYNESVESDKVVANSLLKQAMLGNMRNTDQYSVMREQAMRNFLSSLE